MITAERKKRGRERGRGKVIDPEVVAWLSERGFTNEQIAEKINVSPALIYSSKINQTDIVRNARMMVDSEVCGKLFQLAIGYRNEDGVLVDPSFNACRFWLSNRMPEQWREKRELKHTGLNYTELCRQADARSRRDHEENSNNNYH